MARAGAFAQYMLELINRFRLDPGGEFDRILRDPGAALARDKDTTAALKYFKVDVDRLEAELDALSPAQPLAWNVWLADAARGHSRLLKQSDTQSHQVSSLGEASLGERVRDAGYDYAYVAENVYSYARSVQHAQDAFIVDWGLGTGGMQDGRGHRASLIDPGVAEIGIGVVRDTSSTTSVGPYIITQDLGLSAESGPFLLGVAYRDADGDDAYGMGEGLRGLKVRVDGDVASAARAGGYAIAAAEGDARVVLFGQAVEDRIVATVTFDGANVKLDVVDRKHLLSSGDIDLQRGARSLSLLGHDDTDASGKAGRDRLCGNSGDNTLDGEGGRDRVLGGGGRDTVIGGNGNDRLSGGRGADVFAFDADDGTDRILDWGGGDALRLTGVDIGEVDISSRRGHAVVQFGETVVILLDEAGNIGADDLLLA